jgi:uncharacterized iron-regulated membrane protein
MPRTQRKLRKTFEVTHRWASMTLGLVLIAIATSGAVLLYLPQLERVAHPGLYDTTHGDPISATRALAIARADRSGIEPNALTLRDGLWIASGDLKGHAGHARQLHIDAATGKVLGLDDEQYGVLGWLANFHDCFLTCEGYAGFTPLFAHGTPFLGNEGLTVGGIVLGVIGLMLLWLVSTGLWLWWPSIRRFARGFAIRRRRGTYAFNYDLHKVVGAAALPFLAMWAFTGGSFELKQFEDAWYGVLPGERPPEYAPPTSKPLKGKSVSLAQAQQAVKRELPNSRLTAIYLPDRTDKTSAYEFAVADGYDARSHSNYPGDVDVGVDRYSGVAHVTYPTAYTRDRPVAQSLFQDFQFAAHAGTPVNGAIRVIWLIFGLTPLLLAVTGVTTWWMRRRRRRARKPAARPVGA